MRSRRKIRVAVVDSHPIQYHYQYFRLLARDQDIDLRVFYCLDTKHGVHDPCYGTVRWDVPLLNGYSYSFLPNHSPRPGFDFFGQINPKLITILNAQRFDVVWVWGYSSLTSWVATLTSRTRGIKVLFRGEATLNKPLTALKTIIKQPLVHVFLKAVDAVAYSCTANRRYYEHYGVRGDRLVFAPCAVDNKFFQDQATRINRVQCRRELGFDDNARVVLFLGRLIREKAISHILRAYERMHALSDRYLIVVGDGPLRNELETYCARRGLVGVRFVGFKNQTEIAKFYAASDLFIVVSSIDLSPKALNEAMNFGLPVVVSDRVGTAEDLVFNGKNGFINGYGDIPALTTAMETILSDRTLAISMGRRSREIVNRWSFDRGYQNIRQWLMDGSAINS